MVQVTAQLALNTPPKQGAYFEFYKHSDKSGRFWTH